ncbi:putative dienelactone hydrolase [Rhizobium sp. BK529]|uniref:alpha/beta hydrolase family protein n=1 Tax=unclassified Rhizobium TaxID=2613769 RepID=UPI0010488084|nr:MULTISPECIES: dienelactone hydrolase [unclassified Rhizobium]MBB3590738.1 putative dienelactone hydrolase [Rhizobium sp. BK529]TCS09310.1 putative dienelactone hydrolase [Rhizobium sp. BK418]
MKALIKIAAMVCAGILPAAMAQHSAAASDFVGVRQTTAPSKERGTDVPVIVWYPADAGGKPVTLGESRFFVGTDAMLDAPVAHARYPVILLSHGAGLGGTPEAMSWIATPLARQGFIVAAPVHVGNGGAHRSAAETMKLWLRPADISATLDALEKQPLFGDHIEPGRTGVLGLSMGGNTALALAGGRIDPIRLAGYCDDGARNPSLCGWVKQSGVDLHAMDMKLADRDNRDKRIEFAMAIDPAPVDVFQTEPFSKVSIPVEIVNLGKPGAIPLTVLASGIAKAIPKGMYSVVGNASHYSIFGMCKPDAAEMAKSADIDEPICSDSDGRSRLEIHRELIDMVIKAFDQRLKTSPGR